MHPFVTCKLLPSTQKLEPSPQHSCVKLNIQEKGVTLVMLAFRPQVLLLELSIRPGRDVS